MTALDAVSVYLPETRVPIEDLADPLGLSDVQVKLFRRFHGLSEVRRDPGRSVTDLLQRAVAGLSALRGQEHRVRFVLWGRAFPTVVPYPDNPLHDVCRAAGLDHAVAFTVTQQSCCSGMLAIDLAGEMLAGEDDPDALALVLTGEKAFTLDAQLLPETSIFGEGATACLVSADGPRDRLLGYACRQRGEFDVAGGQPAGEFQREYRPTLIEVIRQALDRAGLGLGDLRVILPHNVNVVTWQRLARKLPFPLDRIPLDNVPANGHIYCSDGLVNYVTAVDRGLLRPGDRYLVANVGAGHGATFAAMVFEH